jgi:hypothetical protein
MHKCPAYKCEGNLEKNGENFTCNTCHRTYGKPTELKDYEDYESMYKDDLVVAVRNLLKRIENKGDHDLEDSPEHNDLKQYFNWFGLHKKSSKEQFEILNFIE